MKDVQFIGEWSSSSKTVEIRMGREALGQIRIEKGREWVRRIIKSDHSKRDLYGRDLDSLVAVKDFLFAPVKRPLQSAEIMLIDVNNNCLVVSGNSHWRYAALSYVWGNSTANNLQTTRSNRIYLQKPRSLLTSWKELPHTISMRYM
jgi:hypothetical protein